MGNAGFMSSTVVQGMVVQVRLPLENTTETSGFQPPSPPRDACLPKWSAVLKLSFQLRRWKKEKRRESGGERARKRQREKERETDRERERGVAKHTRQKQSEGESGRERENEWNNVGTWIISNAVHPFLWISCTFTIFSQCPPIGRVEPTKKQEDQHLQYKHEG